MNTQLQKLFEKSNLRDKDKYEINQIFELLHTNKKNNLLNNFDILVSRLEHLHKEIELERRILIWDFYKKVEEFYRKVWDKI